VTYVSDPHDVKTRMQEFGAEQKAATVRVAEEAAALAANPLEHPLVKVSN
jgi:hypothetical protein